MNQVQKELNIDVIQRLSRSVIFFCNLALVILIIVFFLLFLVAVGVMSTESGEYSIMTSIFPVFYRGCTLFVLLCDFLIWYKVISHIKSLCRLYLAGVLFTKDTVFHIRSVGQLIIIYFFLIHLVFPIIGFMFTVMLLPFSYAIESVLEFDGGTAFLFILGLLILCIARVMEEGRILKNNVDFVI